MVILHASFEQLHLVHVCDQGKNGECQHHCVKKGLDAMCSCKKGFILMEDGKSCKKGEYASIAILSSSDPFVSHVLNHSVHPC